MEMSWLVTQLWGAVAAVGGNLLELSGTSEMSIGKGEKDWEE